MLMQYLENVYQQFPKCQKLQSFATIYFVRYPPILKGYCQISLLNYPPGVNSVAKPVPAVAKPHQDKTILKFL